jgi:peptidoglycan/LPS O-acetylase OafA/YrhL
VFSLLVAWLLVPQPGMPVPDAKSVVVNGLLLQDAIDASTPNRAFWSIAVEAHLYLVFPLLLLLLRRAGGVAMLAAVTVVVAAVGVLAPHTSWAAWLMRLTPQFAVLFAVGILAAGVVVAAQRWRRWPWGLLAVATAVPALALMVWRGSAWALGANVFWVDIALGPAIGCLLAAVATGRPARLVRLLDTRPLRGLGLMSYSLYLTHAPIIVVINEFVVAGRVRQGVPSFLVSLVLMVPVTVTFAWYFARAFEIPFLRHRGWAALRRPEMFNSSPIRWPRNG